MILSHKKIKFSPTKLGKSSQGGDERTQNSFSVHHITNMAPVMKSTVMFMSCFNNSNHVM
jgi:hypothetical protein